MVDQETKEMGNEAPEEDEVDEQTSWNDVPRKLGGR